MPSFATGTVVEIRSARPGLQRIRVSFDGAGTPESAYVLTEITGAVEVGDEVVVNTTAVDLQLGTGGWHFVHWNLAVRDREAPGGGHIMKLRYTGSQLDTGSVEEDHPELGTVDSIEGMPVVVAELHSQVPAIALAVKLLRTSARVAYVMTDGAALPLALSDLVAELRARGLLDVTITTGHAFGGDYEAVSMPAALAAARHVAGADVAIVAMGPGIVGTGSRLGFTGFEVGPALDVAAALGGDNIAPLRVSFADPRPRHQGVSHHSITTLRLGCARPATLPLPVLPAVEAVRVRADLEAAGLHRFHRIVELPDGAVPDVVSEFETLGLAVSSMGRPAAADPALFLTAAAAGAYAIAGRRGPAPPA